MLSDYIDWCFAHGNAGYLLLVATLLGTCYLGAAVWAFLFWRD